MFKHDTDSKEIMTHAMDQARIHAQEAEMTNTYLDGAFDGAHEKPLEKPTDLTYLQGYISGLRNLLHEERNPQPQYEYEAVEF